MDHDHLRDRWCVWNVKAAPCCGRKRVYVYIASLIEIECECGAWMLTPLGQRLEEAKN